MRTTANALIEAETTASSDTLLQFKVRSAKTMKHSIPKPIEWLIKPLIVKGNRIIFYGEPGCQKSWITIDMGLHIAAGQSWLEQFPVGEPLNVLYLDEEMAADLLDRRVKRLMEGSDIDTDKFMAISLAGFRVTKEHLKKLASDLQVQGFNPQVVIMETIRRVVDGDDNSAKDAAEFWRRLEPLHRNKVSIIVTHHTKKPGQFNQDIKYMAAGSADWRGGADGDYGVAKDKFSIVTVTSGKLRDAEEPAPFTLRLEANQDGETGPAKLIYVGTQESAKGEEEKAADSLRAWIKERGNSTLSRKDVLDYLKGQGFSQGTAYRTWRAAKATGTQVKHGVFNLNV